MKKNKRIGYLRIAFLALFTILVSTASYLHVTGGGSAAPSIHALCPFGGLESLYQVFTAGSLISKIFSGTMVLFGVTLVMAILFRRSFCGLICPFGAIQEFFARIGQLVFKRRLIMPAKIDRPLRYLKYIVLLITVAFAWMTAGLWMAPYDPWSAYGHLAEGIATVWETSAVGLILLVITIIGSVLYDRFFCKYLCPMGAFYAIIGKISPLKVVRNEETCISCGLCNKACPVNIDVMHTKEVRSAECLNCQLCVLKCPVSGALENKMGKKSWKPLVVMILVIALFFGTTLGFKAAGFYQLTPNQAASGELINYGDIKGSMTIAVAAQSTSTELAAFYVKFQIPASVPPETKMKDIVNTVPDYDFDAIKASFK